MALGHTIGHHELKPSEEFLMLQLLIGETYKCFESYLVTQPMISREFKHLGRDETFHESEYARIGSALDLTEKSLLIFVEKVKLVEFRDAVGTKFL
jgi:hypothetical protein